VEERSLEQSMPALEPAYDTASAASHFWSVLSQMHSDMNAISRTNTHCLLTDTQIEVINGVLHKVMQILAESGRAQNLRLLEKSHQTTAGDALIILGHFRGSLRAYRVDVLNESQFSF
jgi:hypothetical protein